MANPCKNCKCCRITTKEGDIRFWCSQGAFDFAFIPDDNDLDFEYMQSVCADFDDMDKD